MGSRVKWSLISGISEELLNMSDGHKNLMDLYIHDDYILGPLRIVFITNYFSIVFVSPQHTFSFENTLPFDYHYLMFAT